MRWLLLLLLLVGCGGGGGSGLGDPPENPSAPSRVVHFGYYGTGDRLSEVAGHVSLTWEGDWSNHVDLPAHLDIARAHGLHAIIHVERYLYQGNRYVGTAEAVRPILTQLRKLGMLDLVIGFYPADEPDLHYPDSDVRSANTALRTLCTDFPELNSCLLVVIYSDHQPVGLSSYDWVGWDRYGSGPQSQNIGPQQRLILVPGGADPWRESPDSFESFAQTHPAVVAVIPFLYLDYAGGYGIGNNGLRQAYCKAGRALTLKAGPC